MVPARRHSKVTSLFNLILPSNSCMVLLFNSLGRDETTTGYSRSLRSVGASKASFATPEYDGMQETSSYSFEHLRYVQEEVCTSLLTQIRVMLHTFHLPQLHLNMALRQSINAVRES